MQRLKKMSELRRAYQMLKRDFQKLQESFAREQYLARTDDLTGVCNRRAIIETMERETSFALRYGYPLSVVIFDIDDFKEINDNFGHSVGDRALRHFAQVASTQLRSADVIGRFGGDEFIVLCPQTNEHQALAVSERIRSCSSDFLQTEKGPLRITTSVGIAALASCDSCDQVNFDPSEILFRRADQSLYVAKQEGKNRMVLFGKDVQELR